jgi:hypothetical protein
MFAVLGIKSNVYSLLVGKPEGKRAQGRLRHGWWVILRWSLKAYDGFVYYGLVWHRNGTGVGLL